MDRLKEIIIRHVLHVHVHVHVHNYTRYTHVYICIHVSTHAHTHTLSHMQIHIPTLSLAHTHTHTHTHTYLNSYCEQTWINTFKMIQDFNPAPIIIAALSAAVLIVFKICNKLLQKPKVKVPFPVYERRARTCTTKKIKWPIPIPSQLIVVSAEMRDVCVSVSTNPRSQDH